jgi:hypothetical protein
MMVAGRKRIDRPEETGANQRRSRLVDLERMLQSDGRISDDKDDNDGSEHVTVSGKEFYCRRENFSCRWNRRSERLVLLCYLLK